MPKSVGIIHCVGSRDRNFNNYCSVICCMQGLKFAHLVKERTGKAFPNDPRDQLRGAADAGLGMFTHVGNDCPMTLHRHDNIVQVFGADEHDGRLVRLALTTLGQETVRTERAHRDRWITERLENLSVPDQQLLHRAAELLEELVAR